jgi:hypothetical protein
MGFLDKVKHVADQAGTEAKKLAGQAKEKADDFAEQHGDKIKGGIDKAADVAGKKLGKGKADKVHSIADKAKGVVDDMARHEPGEADAASEGAATGSSDPTAADAADDAPDAAPSA